MVINYKNLHMLMRDPDVKSMSDDTRRWDMGMSDLMRIVDDIANNASSGFNSAEVVKLSLKNIKDSFNTINAQSTPEQRRGVFNDIRSNLGKMLEIEKEEPSQNKATFETMKNFLEDRENQLRMMSSQLYSLLVLNAIPDPFSEKFTETLDGKAAIQKAVGSIQSQLGDISLSDVQSLEPQVIETERVNNQKFFNKAITIMETLEGKQAVFFFGGEEPDPPDMILDYGPVSEALKNLDLEITSEKLLTRAAINEKYNQKFTTITLNMDGGPEKYKKLATLYENYMTIAKYYGSQIKTADVKPEENRTSAPVQPVKETGQPSPRAAAPPSAVVPPQKGVFGRLASRFTNIFNRSPPVAVVAKNQTTPAVAAAAAASPAPSSVTPPPITLNPAPVAVPDAPYEDIIKPINTAPNDLVVPASPDPALVEDEDEDYGDVVDENWVVSKEQNARTELNDNNSPEPTYTGPSEAQIQNLTRQLAGLESNISSGGTTIDEIKRLLPEDYTLEGLVMEGKDAITNTAEHFKGWQQDEIDDYFDTINNVITPEILRVSDPVPPPIELDKSIDTDPNAPPPVAVPVDPDVTVTDEAIIVPPPAAGGVLPLASAATATATATASTPPIAQNARLDNHIHARDFRSYAERVIKVLYREMDGWKDYLDRKNSSEPGSLTPEEETAIRTFSEPEERKRIDKLHDDLMSKYKDAVGDKTVDAIKELAAIYTKNLEKYNHPNERNAKIGLETFTSVTIQNYNIDQQFRNNSRVPDKDYIAKPRKRLFIDDVPPVIEPTEVNSASNVKTQDLQGEEPTKLRTDESVDTDPNAPPPVAVPVDPTQTVIKEKNASTDTSSLDRTNSIYTPPPLTSRGVTELSSIKEEDEEDVLDDVTELNDDNPLVPPEPIIPEPAMADRNELADYFKDQVNDLEIYNNLNHGIDNPNAQFDGLLEQSKDNLIKLNNPFLDDAAYSELEGERQSIEDNLNAEHEIFMDQCIELTTTQISALQNLEKDLNTKQTENSAVPEQIKNLLVESEKVLEKLTQEVYNLDTIKTAVNGYKSIQQQIAKVKAAVNGLPIIQKADPKPIPIMSIMSGASKTVAFKQLFDSAKSQDVGMKAPPKSPADFKIAVKNIDQILGKIEYPTTKEGKKVRSQIAKASTAERCVIEHIGGNIPDVIVVPDRVSMIISRNASKEDMMIAAKTMFHAYLENGGDPKQPLEFGKAQQSGNDPHPMIAILETVRAEHNKRNENLVEPVSISISK